MLTQKQISINQVIMGLVHLLFSFEQSMMSIIQFRPTNDVYYSVSSNQSDEGQEFAPAPSTGNISQD